MSDFRRLCQRIAASVARTPHEQMIRLANGNDGGLLSIGLLGALWSSSAALVAMIDAMNRAYDIEESRPWWKVRLTGILLTIGLAVFIVLAFGLIVAGPEIARWLAGRLAMGAAFIWTWNILQWPVAFALVATGIGLIYYFYYFAPDAEQDFAWITPGSVIATVLWLIGSLAFRFYVVNFGNYEATYGTIAGVILLLLWFYLSGLVLIVGAEASAEIEHASPWGKAPVEKVPGQKRKIGAAAARAFRERAREPLGSPSTAPVPRDRAMVPHIAPQPSFFERAAALLVVLFRWRSRMRS